MEIEKIARAPKKPFKVYYQDPEFRRKHKEYIMTKLPCKCGANIARCNATHHKKSVRHTKYLKNLKVKELSDEMMRLKVKLDKLLLE